MNRADEVRGIIAEDNKKCKHSSCRKIVCIDCLTQALVESEEKRLKPLREVYEKYKKHEILCESLGYPKEARDMFQAIKQSLGEIKS